MIRTMARLVRHHQRKRRQQIGLAYGILKPVLYSTHFPGPISLDMSSAFFKQSKPGKLFENSKITVARD